MILQPLVENCIKYGLKEGTGYVILKVEQTVFDTTVSISDNGGGMSEEQRHAILSAGGEKAVTTTGMTGSGDDAPAVMPKNTQTGSGTGTGLINVVSRLRLYFHRADVFDIQTNADGGTSFILKIPRLEKKVV